MCYAVPSTALVVICNGKERKLVWLVAVVQRDRKCMQSYTEAEYCCAVQSRELAESAARWRTQDTAHSGSVGTEH